MLAFFALLYTHRPYTYYHDFGISTVNSISTSVACGGCVSTNQLLETEASVGARVFCFPYPYLYPTTSDESRKKQPKKYTHKLTHYIFRAIEGTSIPPTTHTHFFLCVHFYYFCSSCLRQPVRSFFCFELTFSGHQKSSVLCVILSTIRIRLVYADIACTSAEEKKQHKIGNSLLLSSTCSTFNFESGGQHAHRLGDKGFCQRGSKVNTANQILNYDCLEIFECEKSPSTH